MFQVILQCKVLISSCFCFRVLPVDLSDPEATRAVVNEAKELFGKVDILVNNAGKNLCLCRSEGLMLGFDCCQGDGSRLGVAFGLWQGGLLIQWPY